MRMEAVYDYRIERWLAAVKDNEKPGLVLVYGVGFGRGPEGKAEAEKRGDVALQALAIGEATGERPEFFNEVSIESTKRFGCIGAAEHIEKMQSYALKLEAKLAALEAQEPRAEADKSGWLTREYVETLDDDAYPESEDVYTDISNADLAKLCRMALYALKCKPSASAGD